MTLEDGPIGCPKSQQGVTTLCCVTPQKSTDLIYIVAEVLNHANNLHHKSLQPTTVGVIAESEREGTLAETRIGLSAKRTSPFKSAGRSVQSTTGSRGVRISRQDYWLPTPFASFPFTSPPVRHRVPSHSDSALPLRIRTASDTWQHIDNKRRVHTSTDLELVTE